MIENTKKNNRKSYDEGVPLTLYLYGDVPY